jgi:hypothetical protein
LRARKGLIVRGGDGQGEIILSGGARAPWMTYGTAGEDSLDYHCCRQEVL